MSAARGLQDGIGGAQRGRWEGCGTRRRRGIRRAELMEFEVEGRAMRGRERQEKPMDRRGRTGDGRRTTGDRLSAREQESEERVAEVK
jgi:hypothetical protein